MTTYFSAPDLLEPPTERSAFSDRQAYVCAELSRLAYFKFEGGNTLEEVLSIARQVLGDDSRFAELERQLRGLLTVAPSDAASAEAAFRAILHEGGFELVKTFSSKGTQAFICRRKIPLITGGHKSVAVLAFRGTEPRQFEDIKTDVKAPLKAVQLDGQTVEFHTGYLEALDHVADDVTKTIADAAPDQLIVTGHSLGGALAIVFTRLHATSTNGACYTFGAPPVGAIEVQNGLKTPVYEIINELDIVPQLPNPWLGAFTGLLLKLVRMVSKLVTVVERLLASGKWDEKLEKFFGMLIRYRHPGYVSYLTGSGREAYLRYNLSTFDRVRLWFAIRKNGLSSFKKLVADHMIDVYVEKLKDHARKRQ